MSAPVPVIVACGSGVATSQIIAAKVNKMFEEDGIDAQVKAVDLKSVDKYLDTSAAYITIVRDKKSYDIPVIDGIAFMTGVGQDDAYQKLCDAVRAYQEKHQ